ncbi:sensory neuron membrane protein 2-like isoform X5 [Cotesia glomerata]|uniref:sensory neuron membrane protein 2-like isoform X5 n=1 Tax=Cotesia glomerata TaxID=32391 RepID=UPI001D0343D3|nr:sensory neuron membrane protein 2-like isoform X5 [Cotesia glomerata]
MSNCRSFCRNFLSFIPGLLLISLGIYLAVEKPHSNLIVSQLRESAELKEGKFGYDVWKDLNIYFKVNLFHVTNPENVMEGESPILEERGPYVYDLNVQKRVTQFDEELDELTFTVYRLYRFNKDASTGSEDDDIVILNSAYLGTLNTNNDTETGPFTVNRGVIDKDALGNTTSYKKMRVTKYWSQKECNVVAGTDAITWPPMTEKLPYVTVYEPNICRQVRPRFKEEVTLNGIMGYRYEMDDSTWDKENSECYCLPNAKKVPQCLETGLMDIIKCQDVPVIFSEPHFLHADPILLEYARGLKPNPVDHATYITIEPLSGAPLSGAKKLQLNVKVTPLPGITLLSNVSTGYFPILWAEETKTPDIQELGSIINAHRLLNVFKYMTWVPIIIGSFLIIKLLWCLCAADNEDKLMETNHTPVQAIRISPRSHPAVLQPSQGFSSVRPANRNRRNIFAK